MRFVSTISNHFSYGKAIRVLDLIKAHHSISIFATSTMVDSLVSLLTSIVLLRWVEPATMGIWQTLLLFSSYGDVIKLGIFSGLNRELPFLLGKGEKTDAYQMASTAQFFSLVIACLGMIIFMGAALICQPVQLASSWKFGLTFMGLFWFVSVYNSYLQVTFRTNDEFKKLSYVQILHSILSVASLFMVAFWGYRGMVARSTLLILCTTIALHFIRPLHVPSRFSYTQFRKLLYTGLPIYGSTYLYIFAMGLDRVFLLRTGDTNIVGLYAPANVVISVMMIIPMALVAYMSPRLVYGLGKGLDTKDMWKPTLRMVGISFSIALLMAIVGWFTMPFVIRTIFSEYSAGIVAAQIMLIAGVFLSTRTSTMTLIVLKNWGYLYAYIILFLLFRWVFLSIFMQRYEPLSGAAIASAFSFFVMSVIGMWISYLATRRAPNT